MIEWIVEKLTVYKRKKREKKVLYDCGCVCFCPHCGDILNDQAECVDDFEAQKVYYMCMTCEELSTWTFDAAPVPILLNPKPK